MSNFPAIQRIVKKAITANHTDDEITNALARLVEDGRGVTTETLRVEIEGMPAHKKQSKGSTTDERVMAGLALVEKYRKEEECNEQKRLNS